jgi:hypothetical protein
VRGLDLAFFTQRAVRERIHALGFELIGVADLLQD